MKKYSLVGSVKSVVLMGLFLFGAGSVNDASAAPYKWRYDLGSFIYESPEAACVNFRPGGETRAVYRSPTEYRCEYWVSSAGNPFWSSGGNYPKYATRTGDTCADGSTYNAGTGLCDALDEPTCDIPSGTEIFAETDPSLPSSICVGSCSLAASGVRLCTTNPDGSKVCGGGYKTTGAACSQPTPGVDDSPDSCPSGTKNVSTDPGKVFCEAMDKPKPTCWAGSHNVSSDPNFAICVGDTPTDKQPQPDPAIPAQTTKTEIQEEGKAVDIEQKQTTNTNGSTTTTTTISETIVTGGGSSVTNTSTTIVYSPASANSEPAGYAGGSTGPQECGTPGRPKCQIDFEADFTDGGLPGVPQLYTPKYPDGISGVWEANKPNIDQTQFWQGVSSMFPTFGAGACPAWSMNFSMGAVGNFGSIPFDVPCWIFQAIGLIILATAAFTARKIIF